MFNKNTFFESYTRIFGEQIKLDDNGKRFFDYFYKIFSKSHPDVAKAFQNTNMDEQKVRLRKSLLYSINFITNSDNFNSMQQIAISHNRHHYNIKPELYDIWMDCMITTVKEFDPLFNDDIELAWRLAFAPGITYMKFMYNKQ